MSPPILTIVSALALLVASPTPESSVAPVDVSIVGLVEDASTGQPLTGAQVSLPGRGVGALTGRNGRYLLLLGDSYVGRTVTVTVRLIGYASTEEQVTLSAGENTVNFQLSAVPITMDSLRLPPLDVRGRVVDAEARPVTIAATTFSAGLAAERAARRAVDFNRESYAHIEENDFVAVESNPLSTFSIDVDRASYSNVRRFIRDGVRPPIDAVRIEELVNYFTYSDPEPRGDVPLTVTTEVAPAPWQPLHHLVRIGLRGRSIDMSEAPPNNLVFLLDVSGSMRSPDKLPLLKTAFAMLVDQMRPQDRVAIVVYAGAAGLVLPSTTGSEKGVIHDALQRLSAGGSTAGGAGIRLAYAVAAENHIDGGNNRVILATDGDFNVGASSDAEMVRLIEEKREQGTFLTVLGFGTGNLQDAKMEQIADHGNGNFAYIDGPLEAKKVLVSELGGTLVTIAQDVKIQVELNPARVAAYRLIGYENRLLAAEDFNDDTKDAGELGAGHSVTALYEVIPVGVETPVQVRDLDPLRYQRDRAEVGESGELMFVKLRYQEPGGSPSRLISRPVEDVESSPSDDFRFAAAVAAWGMLFRDSEYLQDFTLDDVARLARSGVGEDREGYRTEFLELVDRSRSLEILSLEPGVR
jgi:Ca-activated chloride channel family protein